MNEPTLTVFHDETPIFTSDGTWLHPLFELEDYLAEHPVEPVTPILQDKMIGKAAALPIFCGVIAFPHHGLNSYRDASPPFLHLDAVPR